MSVVLVGSGTNGALSRNCSVHLILQNNSICCTPSIPGRCSGSRVNSWSIAERMAGESASSSTGHSRSATKKNNYILGQNVLSDKKNQTAIFLKICK